MRCIEKLSEGSSQFSHALPSQPCSVLQPSWPPELPSSLPSSMAPTQITVFRWNGFDDYISYHAGIGVLLEAR